MIESWKVGYMYVDADVTLSYILIAWFQAYDSHCNLVLGDVEETIYLVDDDDEEEEEVKVHPPSLPTRFEKKTNDQI